MNSDATRNDRLVPLSSLKDYKIAKDNPDVLGWRVVGADGESLGIVRDLIVDPRAMKARYLSVVADRKYFNTDNDQYLLVPIGVAALDKGGRKVFISSIDSNTIGRYPLYQGGPITADYEYAVRDTFHRAQHDALEGTAATHKSEFDEALERQRAEERQVSDDFYNDDTYNEERFYASNQEVHRDKVYSTRAYNETDTTADLHTETGPKTVEDSIATIERLEDLRKRGSLTEEEFVMLKRKALNL